MAQPDFTLGEGATSPILEEVLYGPDGNPMDLTGTTAEFRMSPWDASVPAVVRAAEVVTPTIVDGDPTGIVRFTFLSTDTNGHPGWWRYQWIPTFPGGENPIAPSTYDPPYRTLFVIAKLV